MINRSDYELRDRIIFERYIDWVKFEKVTFKNIDLSKFKLLIEHNFISMDHNKGFFPTPREFLDFIEIYSEFSILGFVTAPHIEDYLIIDGLSLSSEIPLNMESEIVLDFEKFCCKDSLVIPSAYCVTENLLFGWWN
jgi:hypothetical protein